MDDKKGYKKRIGVGEKGIKKMLFPYIRCTALFRTICEGQP